MKKSRFPPSMSANAPSPTATGIASNARQIPIPGIHGDTDDPDRRHACAGEQTEDHEAEAAAGRDVTDTKAVLGEVTDRFGDEQRRKPHDDPAADANPESPTIRPVIPPRAISRKIVAERGILRELRGGVDGRCRCCRHWLALLAPPA